jgi:hypothetical protein
MMGTALVVRQKEKADSWRVFFMCIIIFGGGSFLGDICGFLCCKRKLLLLYLVT